MHLSQSKKSGTSIDNEELRSKIDETRALLKKKKLNDEEISMIDSFIFFLPKIQLKNFVEKSKKDSLEIMLKQRIEAIFENIIGSLYQKKEEFIKKAFPITNKYSELINLVEKISDCYRNLKTENFPKFSRLSLGDLLRDLESKISSKFDELPNFGNLEQLLVQIQEDCSKVHAMIDNFLLSTGSQKKVPLPTHPKNLQDLIHLKAIENFPEIDSYPISARNSIYKLIKEAEKGLFDNQYTYRFYQIKRINLILVTNRSFLKAFRITKGSLKLILTLKLNPGTAIDTELLPEKSLFIQAVENNLSIKNIFSRKNVFHKQLTKPIQGIRLACDSNILAVLSFDDLTLFKVSGSIDIMLTPMRKITLDLRNSYIHSFQSMNNILVLQKRMYLADYEEVSKIYFFQIKERDDHFQILDVQVPENQNYSQIGEFRIIPKLKRIDFLRYSFYNDKIKSFSFHYNERGIDSPLRSRRFSILKKALSHS